MTFEERMKRISATLRAVRVGLSAEACARLADEIDWAIEAQPALTNERGTD